MKLSCILILTASIQLIGNPLSASSSNKDPAPKEAKALGKQLMNNLPGVFSLDQKNKEKLGDYEVPTLQNGDWIISSEPVALVDSFSSKNNVITTIFIKVGDEYVRLSTTEENESPGTILDHASPAYKRLLGELRYTGKVTLSNQDYMTDYDVFRDRQGRVIGAYLVGIPIGQQ